LSHVLAREPIEARPAGAAMRLRRWAQRNPARAVATALAAAIVVGGPLTFGLVQHGAAVKEREFRQALGLAKSQVDDANKELVATNSELERKRADLAGALGRERDERDRAQENLEQALDAVDTLLTRVGDQKLAWIPQMEGVRRDLLEDALKFYVRFVDQRGDDPRVRLRQAMTQRKVSSIRGELGQPAAARESAAASVATFARARARRARRRRRALAADLVARAVRRRDRLAAGVPGGRSRAARGDRAARARDRRARSAAGCTSARS
jgi:hypothetical protein